jgi:DNA-binding transcriptional LysR family regulator
MRAFVAVVDTGSFAAAAERLELSRARLTKMIQDLEEHLGTRLINRTTRRLNLTEAGGAYHERCAAILADVAEAEEVASHLTALPRGTLKLTVPVSFGILKIAPLLGGFLERHPEVSVDMTLNDRKVDLIDEGFDLAIRVGALAESGLIARRLATDHIVICAAPAYLKRHGTPRTPQDLARHACLSYTYATTGDEWRFTGPAGEVSVRIRGPLRANNGDTLRLAALSGAGIIRQPTFLVQQDLDSGRLVRLLEDYRSSELGIYAVYPTRRFLSAKVSAFIDYLSAALQDGFSMA